MTNVQAGLADRINVTGAAAIDGTLNLLPLGGAYQFNTPYTTTQFGSVAGSFASVTTGAGFRAGIMATVSQAANQVRLALAPDLLVPPLVAPPVVTPPVVTLPTPDQPLVVPPVTVAARGLPGFLTSNLRATAMALDNANRADTDLAAFVNVYNQASSRIGLAINQLSGEIATATPAMGFAAGEQFLAVLLDPLGYGRESVLGGRLRAGTPRASNAKGCAVWGTAMGGYNRTTGDASDGAAARTVRNAGFALGLDVLHGQHGVAGIAIAVGEGSASVASGQGTSRANFGQIGTFGSTRVGSVTQAAAGAFTSMDVETRRTQFFLGSGRQMAGFGTQVYSLRAEARQHGIEINGFRLQPVAALQFQRVSKHGYTETNTTTGRTHGLTLAGQGNSSFRTELGVQVNGTLHVGNRPVRGFARVAWAHYPTRDASMGLGFASLPGAGFTVRSARPEPNSALIAVGLETRIMPGMTLGARLDSEVSGNVRTISGTARVRRVF